MSLSMSSCDLNDFADPEIVALPFVKSFESASSMDVSGPAPTHVRIAWSACLLPDVSGLEPVYPLGRSLCCTLIAASAACVGGVELPPLEEQPATASARVSVASSVRDPVMAPILARRRALRDLRRERRARLRCPVRSCARRH